LIDSAVDLVKAFISGELHVGDRTTGQHSNTVHEEPEEVIRRNAPELQMELRKIWDNVKQQGYKLKEEVVTHYPGNPYKELLARDLEDSVLLFSIASFFFGLFLYAFLLIISMALLSNYPTILNIVLLFLGCIWFIQALACFLGLLPLSRFWLPQKVGDIVVKLINSGMNFFILVDRFGLTRNMFLGFLFGIPILLAKVMQSLVLTPIYLIAGMLLGNRTFGRVEGKVKYYSGYAEW